MVLVVRNPRQPLPWILPSTTSYPLDSVSGATGAYSTRKLSASYSGNCLKIRRSSDNTTQDIAFTGAALDTASLVSFVGAGQGLVDTWYDQSGNSRNLTQGSTSAQPGLVVNGVLNTTIGGQPSLRFDSANGWFIKSSANMSSFITTSNGTVATIFQVHAINTNLTGASIYQNDALWGGAFARCQALMQNASILSEMFDGSSYNTAAKSCALDMTHLHIWMHKSSNTTLYNYLDTSSAATVSTGNNDVITDPFKIGQNYDASHYFNGYVAELILYNTALSTTDRDTLATAMVTPYGITWS